MKHPSSAVAERLSEVRGRIADAAARSGRSAGSIRLIGAMKMVPLEQVRAALEAGLTDLGENRVQEGRAAVEALGRSAARWHLIGHLQRNKVGKALELFDRVHGVDSWELASALSHGVRERSARLPVLLQVNVSGEPSKHGVAPTALPGLVERVAALPGLELDGLMTIGAPVALPEDARPELARTRELRDEVERGTGVPLPELSMGMSGDYEVAIEEGSTMVRIGTALFGPRG